MGYSQESAELIGLRVLEWLVANDELLPVFLGSTGASEGDLRSGAANAVFLGALLDFVMLDDVWVVECCDHSGLPYDSLLRARQLLPGGEQVNWT